MNEGKEMGGGNRGAQSGSLGDTVKTVANLEINSGPISSRGGQVLMMGSVGRYALYHT